MFWNVETLEGQFVALAEVGIATNIKAREAALTNAENFNWDKRFLLKLTKFTLSSLGVGLHETELSTSIWNVLKEID